MCTYGTARPYIPRAAEEDNNQNCFNEKMNFVLTNCFFSDNATANSASNGKVVCVLGLCPECSHKLNYHHRLDLVVQYLYILFYF